MLGILGGEVYCLDFSSTKGVTVTEFRELRAHPPAPQKSGTVCK